MMQCEECLTGAHWSLLVVTLLSHIWTDEDHHQKAFLDALCV